MEICFLASGKTLLVLGPEDFQGRTAKEVKLKIAPRVGVSHFRQQFFWPHCCFALRDDEVFTEAVKIMLVVLDFKPLDSALKRRMNKAAEVDDCRCLAPSDPNVMVEKQYTPLMRSAMCGNTRSLRLLLEATADPEVCKSYTALVGAAEENYPIIVGMLLEARADPDLYCPLFSAARDGNLECVRLLIAGKATVDASFVLGRTPLMQAAHGGNLRTVQLLLASSARCDRVDGDGKTAMDLATARADVNMVRLG